MGNHNAVGKSSEGPRYASIRQCGATYSRALGPSAVRIRLFSVPRTDEPHIDMLRVRLTTTRGECSTMDVATCCVHPLASYRLLTVQVKEMEAY